MKNKISNKNSNKSSIVKTYKAVIRSKNFALFVLATASFMACLDASIVNITLPSLTKYFDAGIAKVQWVVTIYGLGIVALLPLGSKLGSKYGQNKINALGYFLFGLGSLLCALSGGMASLVVSRFIQGAGAAMMFSLSQGVVATIFTGSRRGFALGIIGACVALGNITGPSLGGFLLDTFGWQSIFYINLPVAVFGAYYSWVSLPSLTRKKQGIINITSLVYFIAAAVSFITAFSLAETAGWRSPHILIMLGAAAFFGVLLYLHEEASKSPLINLGLYKNRVFALGNGALVLIFMSMSVNVVLIPFYLQDVYGLSALKTGGLILFFSVAMVITSPLSGRLSGKIGARWLTVGGCCLSIAGMLWYMTLGAQYHGYQIILGQLVMGIGNGMFQSPNNNSIMTAVPRKFYNDASAMNSLSRNIGIVTGVALTVNIFESIKAHFAAGGMAEQAAFSKAYACTLVMGIVLTGSALILSYIGKAAARKERA
jgi:EmrB/QacA subfamily drug resistance transporter